MRRSIRNPIAAPLAALVALTFLQPFDLRAQSDGTPIRLQTAAKPGSWITGRAAGITADSVGIVRSFGTVLTRSHDTLRYARTELHRMEVKGGRKSNVGRGAIGGAAVGLMLGVACVAGTGEDDWAGCEGGGEVVVFTLALGGVGALIGALSHHELWEEVEIAPHVAGGLQGRRGVGLAVAF